MLVHALPLLSLLLSFTPGDTTGPARPTADHPAPGVELKVYAERSRATRLSFVATSVVTGAAMLATGIVLNRRSDDVSQSVGIGLIAGGAAPLLFSALLLRPSPIEMISANFEAASNGGQNPADLRRATEDEWMRAADSGHRKRIVAGTVEVALGAALSAAGTYLLLAKAGVGSMTRNGQYEVASFLIGPGVPSSAWACGR